jgi:hypothetical protein
MSSNSDGASHFGARRQICEWTSGTTLICSKLEQNWVLIVSWRSALSGGISARRHREQGLATRISSHTKPQRPQELRRAKDSYDADSYKVLVCQLPNWYASATAWVLGRTPGIRNRALAQPRRGGLITLLARGASNAKWHSGCLAPDRCVESICDWLIRGPLFFARSGQSQLGEPSGKAASGKRGH